MFGDKKPAYAPPPFDEEEAKARIRKVVSAEFDRRERTVALREETFMKRHAVLLDAIAFATAAIADAGHPETAKAYREQFKNISSRF